MATKVWIPDVDKTMSGDAWRFEGNLDVDWELCPYGASMAFKVHPTKTFTYIERMEGLRTLVMQPLDPDFHKKVKPGDFLIGGDGTGSGHDHDHPCIGLRGAGIAAILCEGTNVNFRRNSLNHGLAVVVVKGIMDAVKTGDRLEVNLVEGWVKNLATQKTLEFKPWPEFLLKIVRDGGLYPWMRKDRSAPDANQATSPATSR